MRLFLYDTKSSTPLLEIENAVSYTADLVKVDDGTIYNSFPEDVEISSLPDCSETLRADWRRAHLSQEERINELEALMAGFLFGGGEEV